MADININLNGRLYQIACDHGQEGRVVDLASYIDQRLQSIARTGAAYNDAHLLVLAALVIADELFDAREQLAKTPKNQPVAAASAASQPAPQAGLSKDDEQMLVKMLEQMTKRIDGIAQRVQAA